MGKKIKVPEWEQKLKKINFSTTNHEVENLIDDLKHAIEIIHLEKRIYLDRDASKAYKEKLKEFLTKYPIPE